MNILEFLKNFFESLGSFFGELFASIAFAFSHELRRLLFKISLIEGNHFSLFMLILFLVLAAFLIALYIPSPKKPASDRQKKEKNLEENPENEDEGLQDKK